MAILNYRIRSTIPFLTGLSTDVSVNDLVFAGDATVDDLDDLFDAVEGFFNTTPTGPVPARAVSGFMSPDLNRAAGACRLDAFVIGTPGPPVASRTWTLGAAPSGTGPLPSECAAVLSFRGAYGAEPPAARARLRGRIFIGPLDRIAGVGVANAYRVSDAFIPNVLQAAFEMQGDAIGTGWEWKVYSPTNASAVDVEFVSMDNAFDTMRSRGVDPTYRTEIAV